MIPSNRNHHYGASNFRTVMVPMQIPIHNPNSPPPPSFRPSSYWVAPPPRTRSHIPHHMPSPSRNQTSNHHYHRTDRHRVMPSKQLLQKSHNDKAEMEAANALMNLAPEKKSAHVASPVPLCSESRSSNHVFRPIEPETTRSISSFPYATTTLHFKPFQRYETVTPSSSFESSPHRSARLSTSCAAAAAAVPTIYNSDAPSLAESDFSADSRRSSPNTSPAPHRQDPSPTQSSNIPAGHSGSISLSLPEDDDVLSPLHCFMRRYCVEAFAASPQDVVTPRYGKSHGIKVVADQVGIRCLYCKHRPADERPERAVCFPSSLRNIYHSIETWQRRHSLVCPDITPWVKKSMTDLMESSKSRAGGRRQYWEDSAERLGMVNTPCGVRFARAPGLLSPKSPPLLAEAAPLHSDLVSNQPSIPVVQSEDRELVTDYLFLLMDQMQTCAFTEEDRSGGRSKVKDNPVGFAGIMCKHCHGKAGFGRYFPTSANALALANSDRNIFNHIQKCRRCPSSTKAELIELSKTQSTKNRRGLRKLFFRKVWERIHHADS